LLNSIYENSYFTNVILVFDTETTSNDLKYGKPRLIELAWHLYDDSGELIELSSFLIIPKDFTIPEESIKIHGITNDRANHYGVDKEQVLNLFLKAVEKSKILVGHNLDFDIRIISRELNILQRDWTAGKKLVCTMMEASKLIISTNINL